MSLLLDHSQTAPLEAVHLEMDQVENTLRDKSALLASICLQAGLEVLVLRSWSWSLKIKTKTGLGLGLEGEFFGWSWSWSWS